jgi:hypothetical protein
MTNTFTHIATVTTGSESVITISNIPQTFRDLRLHFQSGARQDSWNLNLAPNGSTSGSSFWLRGAGLVTIGRTYLAPGSGNAGTLLRAGGVVDIFDYNQTARHKYYSFIGTGTDFDGTITHGGIFQTAAITSLSIVVVSGFGGDPSAGSTIALYGVAA